MWIVRLRAPYESKLLTETSEEIFEIRIHKFITIVLIYIHTLITYSYFFSFIQSLNGRRIGSYDRNRSKQFKRH